MAYRRTLAGATSAALVLAGALTACTAAETCGAGATSPEAAVEAFLDAAAADDVARACTVASAADVDDTVLVRYVDEVGSFLDEAGGVDAVTVRELPERQMGSGLVVEIAADDQRLEVAVLQSGGRYRVAANEPPPRDGEPTTDPEPPDDSD